MCLKGLYLAKYGWNLSRRIRKSQIITECPVRPQHGTAVTLFATMLVQSKPSRDSLDSVKCIGTVTIWDKLRQPRKSIINLVRLSPSLRKSILMSPSRIQWSLSSNDVKVSQMASRKRLRCSHGGRYAVPMVTFVPLRVVTIHICSIDSNLGSTVILTECTLRPRLT